MVLLMSNTGLRGHDALDLQCCNVWLSHFGDNQIGTKKCIARFKFIVGLHVKAWHSKKFAGNEYHLKKTDDVVSGSCIVTAYLEWMKFHPTQCRSGFLFCHTV